MPRNELAVVLGRMSKGVTDDLAKNRKVQENLLKETRQTNILLLELMRRLVPDEEKTDGETEDKRSE